MLKYLLLFLFIFAGLFVLPILVLASVTDGALSGYAWSDQIGWINFGTSEGNARITDTGLTGYAWNENEGRIKLNPTKGGILTDSNGNLSGYAWCEGTGWINFSGVSISSAGVFSGVATGDNGVDINFSCSNCGAQTDWRPANSRGGGGLSPGVYSAPSAPFGILINNGNTYTNNPIVVLKLRAGSDVNKMAISNSLGFENVGQEDFSAEKIWTLSQGDGVKTIYAKFYTKYGQSSQTVQASIILNTVAPSVEITNIKQKYITAEDVIIGGTTSEGNVEIIISIGDRYGYFVSDNYGKWLGTFGKMPVGNYHIELTPKDLAGNIGKTITGDFSIEQSGVTLAPPLPPILQKLQEQLAPFLPQIFKPKEKPLPQPIITVPKNAPIAFRNSWYPLIFPSLTKFALSPLPNDIKMLAEQVPQLGKTFEAVGVQKITDVQKLANANLKMPTLSEITNPSEQNIATAQFATPKGIPIAQLSATARTRIPQDIVFTKTGGGLVDYNIALSLNNKGQTQQTITTIIKSPLQLIVRETKPVKKITGYIVFQSRKANQVSSNVSLNYLTASLSFSDPDFMVNQVPTATQEQRLVLAYFEYQPVGDGVYTATIDAPAVSGQYQIITTIDYADPSIPAKEIKLITVVDPEGYVYEKSGDKETRIFGAVISIYWLNPKTKQYELWPAKDYQQENPQITDVSGTYSFLVPDGYYYLKVDTPGYLSYDGKPFQVTEGSGIHINIELKTKFWWLNIIDWKTALLVIIILMMGYNFYRDKLRDVK